MKVLIIGGVAAGTKVAAKLKRENRDHEVTIITTGKDISYAGCGLPYYVGGLIEDRDELIVNTPKQFTELTGVNVMTETEVTKVNPDEKTVEAMDENTKETSTYEYDKLVIATGARPIRPPFPGIDLENVFLMRTVEDATKLKEALDKGGIKRVVIVGGGFIGLEVAENLVERGVMTTVIDMAEMVPPGFAPEFTDYMAAKLAEARIMIFTGTKLESIMGEGKVEKIKTDKNVMKTDAVVLSIGVSANTGFVQDIGLDMMPNRTIKVNEYLETNLPDIYSVGDCASVTNRLTKQPAWSPMGSTANISGRILAKNINNEEEKVSYVGVLGTGVAKLLPDFNIGRTGLTEVAAREAGYDVETVVTLVDDKAHYYPGATLFTIKMIADRNTKQLLGVQALGEGAVDKIIDIAVVGISMGATLEQMEQMDFAYAPPFSTAIHPFSNTASTLLNKIAGKFKSVTPLDFAAGKVDDYRIIDASIVPLLGNNTYVDLNKIDAQMPDIAKDEKLLLVCSKGKRAYLLQDRMEYYGYENVLVLEGGHILSEVK